MIINTAKIRRFSGIILIGVCILLIGPGIYVAASAIRNLRTSPSQQGALYLTPYLKNGDISSARQLSEVQLMKDKVHAPAYSGYFTINKDLGSHLFFLLVKAQEDPDRAPLLLWLQGGPGKSSLFGQFLDIGPLGIDAAGRLYKRVPSIQQNMNIIYLDQPVGAGFSYTGNTTGYVQTLDQMSEAMEWFLRQFLVMFPEFKYRDFYVAGESYGARAAVGIAHRLLTTIPGDVPLNLSGIICGVGFLGPLLETIDSSQFLFHSGMLDEQGVQEYSQRFQLLRSLVKSNPTAALGLLMRTVGAESGPVAEHTLFQNLTGYDSHASTLAAEPPEEFKQFYRLAATAEFKRAFHVDVDRVLDAERQTVVYYLAHHDMLANISDKLQDLLNEKRVLLYSGQMDTLFPAANLEKYFKSLQWEGSSDFQHATRTPWHTRSEPRKFAGYVTSARNLTYVQLARAGHYPSFDEPEAVYDMMIRFVGS